MLSPAVQFDFKNVTFSFLPHQVQDMDALIKNLELTAPEIIGVAPYEQCKSFVETLSRYQKFTDIRNVGAAIHSMIQNANERMDEVGFNEEDEWTYLAKFTISRKVESSSNPDMALWASCFAAIWLLVRPDTSIIAMTSFKPAALALFTLWWPDMISNLPLLRTKQNANERMDEVGFNEEDEWTYLAKLFGSNAVPGESAKVIQQAIKKAEKEGTVTSKNRWQLIEYLCADYLSGR